MAQVETLLLNTKEVPKLCSTAFQQAINPNEVLKEYLNHDILWEEALCSLKEIGAGSSPWAHLYSLRASEESIQEK